MTSDDWEKGRACAKAFVARFKEFQKDSLPSVIDDWWKRRVTKRNFKVTNKMKCAFAVAISPYLYEGMECPLVIEDYAVLAGVRRDKFQKFASKNPSFARKVLGPEWDRRRRRPSLIDKRSGQVILDRSETPEKAKEDYKRGPPATRISIAFDDQEIRSNLKRNLDFRKGFDEELFEELVSELSKPSPGHDGMCDGLTQMADQFMRFREKHLYAIYEQWNKLIRKTISGIKTLKDRKSNYGPVFLLNCNRTIERLDALSKAIKDDIDALKLKGGSFGSLVLSVVKPLIDSSNLDKERLKDWLKDHGAELQEVVLILKEIGVMVYYVSPIAAREFARYTDFARQSGNQNAQHLANE